MKNSAIIFCFTILISNITQSLCPDNIEKFTNTNNIVKRLSKEIEEEIKKNNQNKNKFTTQENKKCLLHYMFYKNHNLSEIGDILRNKDLFEKIHSDINLDINSKNKNGQTTLHFAIANTNLDSNSTRYIKNIIKNEYTHKQDTDIQKGYNEQIKQINTIDKYFKQNNIYDLLENKENYSMIKDLDECRGPNCLLKRTNSETDYRRQFEEKIVEGVGKEEFLNSLQKDNNNNLQINYTSFASGKLFQDFVILNKILKTIEDKFKNQFNKINLTIIIIEPQQHMIVELASFFQKKEIVNSVKLIYLQSAQDYIVLLSLTNRFKFDILVSADIDEYEQDAKSVFFYGFKYRKKIEKPFLYLILLAAKTKNSLFFNLHKNNKTENIHLYTNRTQLEPITYSGYQEYYLDTSTIFSPRFTNKEGSAFKINIEILNNLTEEHINQIKQEIDDKNIYVKEINLKDNSVQIIDAKNIDIF